VALGTILPEAARVSCEEFFTSDLSQTRETAAHQHPVHWRQREPLLPWGGPIAGDFAICRYLTSERLHTEATPPCLRRNGGVYHAGTPCEWPVIEVDRLMVA